MFTPARRRGSEILDDPDADAALSLRSLRDVAIANRLFGGRQAVLRELRIVLRTMLRTVTRGNPAIRSVSLLDIGTGLGDIPASAERLAARHGIVLHTIGLERSPVLASAAAQRCGSALTANAMRLPFADGSVDVVTCSQVLHHFDGAEAERLLQECTRVARTAVIIGDLRRSWFAVAGLWSTSFLLGFHPVSRHDGVVSVLRGFTRDELRDVIEHATGRRPRVRERPGFRLTAVWSPR